VRLWDATTGRTIATGTHKDWVDDVAFSPDGTLVATASRDGTAMIWTSSTLTPVQPPLTGHVGQVLSVAFSPDGSTLATSGTDGSIIEWSVASHQPVSRLSADQLQPVTRIAFSPDGSRLASSQLDGSVVVWDLHGIAPADNGSQQAASAEVSAGASLADRGVFAPPPPPHMTLTGHTGVVYSVAFSPDGRKLVSAGQDTTARVWDAITGDNLAVLKEHDSDVFDAVFGPTGSVILTASNDGTMREWVMDAPVVPPALAPSPTATPTPRPSPL
jgi:WD40 repeat protein